MEQSEEKRKLFEEMPVPRALASLAVPTIISQLINLIYNVVDTFFIGRTGNSNMMAGVTVSFTLFMLTVAFGNLFGIGGGSLMARLIGQRREQDAKNVSAFAAHGSIVLSVTYSVLVLAFMNPLLNVLGASEQTIGYARQYVMLVVVLGSLPVIFSAVLAHLLRNVGYSRQASIGLSAGGILNIVLDPLFMFVLLPQGMEVFGAALATLLSNVIACIYLMAVYLRMGRQGSPLTLRYSAARNVNRKLAGDLFAVGVPSAILTGLFDVANIFLNALMAAHGDLQLAAIGIVEKVERLPNAMNIGLCQGMLPLVAYNYGSGDHKRMRLAIRQTRQAGLIISFSCLILFQIFAGGLVQLFLDTSSGAAEGLQTLSYAAVFLRIRSLASPVQFLNYNSSYCMQGLGDGRDTMLHAVVRELVFYIPFMFLLNALFGEYGLTGALPLGEGCGAIFALFLLNRFLSKNTKALE